MTILAHDLWAIDHRHVSSNLIGYGPSNHGFACTWGTIQKYSTGRRDPCIENSLELDLWYLWVNSVLVCITLHHISWNMKWHCTIWPTVVGEQLRVFQRKLNGLSDNIQLAAEPANHAVCDLRPLRFCIWILLCSPVSEADFSGAGEAVEGVSTPCTTRRSCVGFLRLLWAEWALQTDSILRWRCRRILGVVGMGAGSRGRGERGERGEVGWSAWGAGCRPGLSRCAWCPFSIAVIHSEQAELQGEVGWRGVQHRVHHRGLLCVRAQSCRRSLSVEGDTVLPSYCLDPETAWPAQISQGDDISWQNDVPN